MHIKMKSCFRRLLLAILFFGCLISVKAQPVWNFDVTMGALLPLGDFKSIDMGNSSAGYSEMGFSLNLDGDYFINERISATGRFNLSRTGIDSDAFSQQLDKWFADYLIEDKVRYDINSWSWNNVAIGLKGNLPFFSNKVFIEIGVFPGVAIPSVPDLNLTIDDETNERYIIGQTEKETKVAFSIMGDLGFRFKISDQMQFAFRGSYFRSEMKFNHIGYAKSYVSGVPDQKIFDREMEIPIQTLGVSAGLVYFL